MGLLYGFMVYRGSGSGPRGPIEGAFVWKQEREDHLSRTEISTELGFFLCPALGCLVFGVWGV